MVDWVIMDEDVKAHPDFETKTLEEILRDYGMNTSRGYSVEDNSNKEKPKDWPKGEEFFGYTYRSPFTGKVCKGPRYIGVARSDGKWRRFVSDFLELPYI